MLHATVAAPFENVSEAHHVALDVSGGVGERVPDAGLSCEVDDTLRCALGECGGHPLGVGKVDTEVAVGRVGLELRESRLLQLDVVVVVDDVQPHDLVAALEQGSGDVIPDEAGTTGDEDAHGGIVPVLVAANVTMGALVGGYREVVITIESVRSTCSALSTVTPRVRPCRAVPAIGVIQERR